MTRQVTIQHPGALARRTIVALWIWLATDVAQGLSCLWEAVQLNRLSTQDAARAMADKAAGPLDVMDCIALAYPVTFLICGCFVLRWLYVVNRNAHAWNDSLAMSPGGNVGWFFVPIVHFWKPLQGVRQTWSATVDPARPDTVPVPGWIRLWWWLWVATIIVGNLSFRLSLKADTPDTLIAVDAIFFATLAIDVPLVVLLRRLIVELSGMQAARLEDRTTLA